MLDLRKQSGIPIKLKDNGELYFYNNFAPTEPDIRTFKELKKFIDDGKKFTDIKDSEPCYFMYRGVFESNNLRYDITILPSKKIGSEFNKTVGHYHPNKPKTKVTYPEIYEVISGRALYLLQKNNLKDAILVEALEGEKVVIPPGYGHVTINPDERPLVMANLLDASFESGYDFYKIHKGGISYIIEDKDSLKVVPNPSYPKKVIPRMARPRDLMLFEIDASRLLFQFQENPEKFSWLNNPEEYLVQLVPQSFFYFK